MRTDRILIIGLTVAAFLILIAGALDSRRIHAEGAGHHPYPRVCFPAKKWAPAPDRDRPCVYIHLYEDGTFRSQVEQFDGDPTPEQISRR